MFMSFDIGGTHIRGRISSYDNGSLKVVTSASTTFNALADVGIEEAHPIEMISRLIKEFEQTTGRDASEIKHVTLAVAGKVDHRRKSAHVVANMTEINADDAKEILLDHGCKAEVHIINDFEAAAFGAAAIDDNTRKLLRGAARPRAIEKNLKKILICGPGTGLGVACLVLDLYKPGQHFVITSEAGHATFGPETPIQHEFIESEIVRRLSYEQGGIRSGARPGLPVERSPAEGQQAGPRCHPGADLCARRQGRPDRARSRRPVFIRPWGLLRESGSRLQLR